MRSLEEAAGQLRQPEQFAAFDARSVSGPALPAGQFWKAVKAAEVECTWMCVGVELAKQLRQLVQLAKNTLWTL